VKEIINEEEKVEKEEKILTHGEKKEPIVFFVIT